MYMMRKALLVLLAAAFLAVPVFSADDDHHLIATEETVEMVLLRQKSVQHELKVTPDEARKIHEHCSRQWKKAEELAKAGKEEREKKFDAMAEENERFLKDCLKPEQRKRLKQIAMQRAGLLWIARSDVASNLGLSAEQKQKVKELHKEAHKEALEILRSNEGKMVKKEHLREMRMKDRRRLMAVLTDEQKRKWKEMIGDEFKGELEFGGGK
jgi:Spy/CpxP family protein refolding chaperone